MFVLVFLLLNILKVFIDIVDEIAYIFRRDFIGDSTSSLRSPVESAFYLNSGRYGLSNKGGFLHESKTGSTA
jgi:hypothetical protein